MSRLSRYARNAPIGAGMRVGVFGGSFDPAHLGHLHTARKAATMARLHRVLWLITPRNPQKTSRVPAPLAARLRQTRAIACRDRRMVVLNWEAPRGLRFAWQTARALRLAHPRTRFVWIMGEDSLTTLHRWMGWRTFAATMPLAVVARPGFGLRARNALALKHAGWRKVYPAQLATCAAPALAWLGGATHPASSTYARGLAQNLTQGLAIATRRG